MCALLLLPVVLAAQVEIPYRLAIGGYRFQFPRDHGSHPEFKLEWWYFTGHLRSPDGREFGYELTFFRNGMDRVYSSESSWVVRDLYLAHFAITDVKERKFSYFEKVNRSGPGIAGTTVDGLHAWNENWSARQDGNAVKLTASADDVAIDLNLELGKAPAIHGANGLSQKAEGAGHASHYYSMTRMATKGSIRIRTASLQVIGESWMDHEFGTNQLTDKQAGWDWFGIQLDNGVDVMLYRMRNRDGSIDPFSSGTIVDTNSTTQHLRSSEFDAASARTWTSPASGVGYPLEWTVSVPNRQATLHITPLLDNQELVTTRSTGIAYWEGAVTVSGTWEGKPVQGRAYVELTGYAERYRPRI